jgi:hypothetical protein
MAKRERSRTRPADVNRAVKPVAGEPVDANGERQGRGGFAPQTELGRRLWIIRQRIVSSGQPLLDWRSSSPCTGQKRGRGVFYTIGYL